VMRDTAPAVSPSKDVRGFVTARRPVGARHRRDQVGQGRARGAVEEPCPGWHVPTDRLHSSQNQRARKGARRRFIKSVRDKLSIKHVIPMRTFQVLSVDARKDFNVDWTKTRMSALEAHEALIKVIKSSETMSIEMVLAKEAISNGGRSRLSPLETRAINEKLNSSARADQSVRTARSSQAFWVAAVEPLSPF
jgi:hypothetical protein